MITSRSEYSDATAFERYALDCVYARPPYRDLLPGGKADTLDLRTCSPSRSTHNLGHAVVRPAGWDKLVSDLRPLLFGAAWKVVDLLVELALNEAGLPPDRPGMWLIKTKSERAYQGLGHCPPLSQDPIVWQSICNLYVSTAETRHALVHRKIQVDQQTGTITGETRGSGSSSAIPLVSVTADEQRAFCRVSQIASEAAITSTLNPRANDDLIWELSTLTKHLGTVTTAIRPRPRARILANLQAADNSWLVDVIELHRQASTYFRDYDHYDIELYIPGNENAVLKGELENAPMTRYVIDPEALPSWLGSTLQDLTDPM